MKKLSLYASLLAAALFAAACGGTSDNRSTTSTSGPPKMPTQDELMALDKKANESYFAHDTEAMAYFLSDNYVGFGEKGPEDKGLAVQAVAEHKCDIKDVRMEEPRMRTISNDVFLLTYRAIYDGTCDGKKLPETRAATVFVRRFDEWKGAYHSETPILASSSDNKAPAAKDSPSDTNKAGVAAKPDEKKAANTAEANTAAAKPNDNTVAANTNPPSPGMKPVYDPSLSEALLTVEKAGWEAWKAKDSKALEDIIANEISFIDATGKESPDKASTLKTWTEPCNVSNVALSDTYSVSVTADIAILLYKANATGTCGGTKLTPVWGGTVFQNQGGLWKAVFASEVPVM